MKNSILILFLFTGLLVKAQQPELFANNWYLTMITVDGEEFSTPPSDVSLPPVGGDTITIDYFTEFENENYFNTTGCNWFEVGVNNMDNHSFSVLAVGVTLAECMYPLYDTHDGRYYHFFGAGQNENFPLDGFLYEIKNNFDNTKTLIITNPEGDQAYYNNSLLSTSEISNAPDFQVVFQNEDLIVKGFKSVGNSISIYDLNGKSMLNAKIKNDKINTRNLPKGIYVVKIRDEKGNVVSKKVRKN